MLPKQLMHTFVLSIAIFIIINSSTVFAANYPLQIIQPQANLDLKNRFYKAYPGLEYNVSVAVIGGEYPYRFKLIDSPQGMSIDNNGMISWINPTVSITPYSVSVEVLDTEANKTTVAWTILVTTDGFRFIDAVNGQSILNGGDGSILKPWKSMKDMYGGDDYDSKYSQTTSGEFIYWRTGRYSVDTYLENNNTRVPFLTNRKALVWLAYPGESPVIDLNKGYISIYSSGDNLYFEGLEFDINSNERGMGIQISSSSNNVTFRRNKFHGLTTGYVGGNNALIFISRNKVGKFWSFQDNEMFDVNKGYGILGYSASHILIENNTLHNINGHGVGPKMATEMWFIRGNHFYDNPDSSINVQYYYGGIGSGDIEISYNFVEDGGGRIRINTNQNAVGGPMYLFRNTFLDDAQQNKVTTENGPFYWTNNVIVNNSAYPDKIERKNVEFADRLIISDNLIGEFYNNIVDAQGNLNPAYRQYIGQRGFQLTPVSTDSDNTIKDINKKIIPLIILRSRRGLIEP